MTRIYEQAPSIPQRSAMRMPIMTERPLHMEQSIPVTTEAPFVHEEPLPEYSREPTEDGYAYEHQAELETKKAHAVDVSEHSANRNVLPAAQKPVYVSESALRRGLQVPTKSKLITSGFAYPDLLSQCDINEEQWYNFTKEITEAARMTAAQWTTTVGTGLGTFVVGGIVLGWLGVIPAVIVGHKVRQNNEIKNLSAARSNNVLQDIIARWNDAVFKPKGLLIRVDLPGEAIDTDTMDILSKKCRSQQKPASQSSSSLARAEKRAAKKALSTRGKASKKGRIVILPLGEEAVRLAATMPATEIPGSPPTQESAPPYESSPVEEQTTMADSYLPEKRREVEV